MRWLLLLLAGTACGIKAPPRAPLDEPPLSSPALVDTPDAGCCEAKK
jgi:hypothetical protein